MHVPTIVKEVYVKKPVHHYVHHEEHSHGHDDHHGSFGSYGGSSSSYGGSSSSYGGSGDDSFGGEIIQINIIHTLYLSLSDFKKM